MSRGRPRVVVALVGIAVTFGAAGCAGSTVGSGIYLGGPVISTGPVTATPPPTTDGAPTTTPEVTTTTTAAPPATTTPATTTPATTTPATASPPAGGLEDQGWVVVGTTFTSTFDLFFGTAEITNTATAARSGIFTFTLTQGGTVVGTLIGSADATPPGQTVSVDLIGGDPFVEGPYDIGFQVDFTY